MYSEGYEKMKKGRAVSLRSRTGHSMLGQSVGQKRGMAHAPTMGMRHAGASHGQGFQGGKHPASPFGGKLARATGYKGTHGDYAAASPQKGFILTGRGG